MKIFWFFFLVLKKEHLEIKIVVGIKPVKSHLTFFCLLKVLYSSFQLNPNNIAPV